MTYYSIRDDENYPNRWHLGFSSLNGKNLWFDQYLWCRPSPTKDCIEIEVQYDGVPLDFTLAAMEVPVLSERARHVFSRSSRDSIQWIRARVVGRPESYWVMNLLTEVDCIDEGRSEFTLDAGAKQGERKYRDFRKLLVSNSLAEGHDLFRLAGYRIVLACSQPMKTAIQEHLLIGPAFICISNG